MPKDSTEARGGLLGVAAPRDHLGHFVPRDCPICGCGRLQYEGHGVWRCDGLADPGHDNLPLVACEYTWEDGEHPETPNAEVSHAAGGKRTEIMEDDAGGVGLH